MESIISDPLFIASAIMGFAVIGFGVWSYSSDRMGIGGVSMMFGAGTMIFLGTIVGLMMVQNAKAQAEARRANHLTADECRQQEGEMQVVSDLFADRTLCLLPDGSRSTIKTGYP
ncbi:hypothetical protein [Paracoccus tegillarcae]|uniref:Uncharacterized protein n=1 Tax=Paracoccus tegillarcae TaxID=1529068 RepID=A0A2K9EVE0_9RHOB|nr:hypothetical protein [Paracoccus tegillarcae]AUH35679.1 hypothetical protein CUV01_19035 [Paracoccus tegillarcae]AUH35745.1 hypothetical protein CUV01_19370 [Paracoccus tegillarcae]